jgi:hypothetical protein
LGYIYRNVKRNHSDFTGNFLQKLQKATSFPAEGIFNGSVIAIKTHVGR